MAPAGRAGRSSTRERRSGSSCKLKPVSFVKPFGLENEHPGYRAQQAVTPSRLAAEDDRGSACAKDTMVIVTYDEFGGQWDHVPPPGQGNNNGPHDEWGPGDAHPDPDRLAVSSAATTPWITLSTTRRRSCRRSRSATTCGRWLRATRPLNSLSNVFAAKQFEADN
jgi:hypothetical protein